MKFPVILSATLALSFSLMACAKKPKMEARVEPPAPIMRTPIVESVPAPAVKDAGPRIQDLLAEALKPVYFPYDQAALPEASKDLLAKAGDLLKQAPAIKVTIEGNADERGTEDYNMALGEKRANVVKAYLTTYGIAANRLSVISYGEEKPSALGHQENDWAQNRRDEFKVTMSGEE